MTPELRRQLIQLLESGDDISTEWARILFPPERFEHELVYFGKQREEEIVANTLAVPLQPVRTFRTNGNWHNKLIFGDNMQVMKSLLEMKAAGQLCNSDGSPGARLVYIDPPFATRRDFSGSDGERAFTDKVVGAQFIEFLRKRLILLRELLSDDGSIYVHLDWKRSAHLRLVMDEVFGQQHFRNEIYWYYYNKMPDSRKGIFPRATDTLLFYVKKAGRRYPFHPRAEDRDTPVRQLVRKKLNGKMVNVKDRNGNLVYQTRTERTVDNVWRIRLIPPADTSENVHYPTQKPEELLARIIETSSDPGDLVLDAFAGSGTTCAVAEKLERRWIGIDCGKLAIYTIQKRLLNLRAEVGNTGKPIQVRPFTLYNAGLYDFQQLKSLPWDSWRFFALQLFQCKDQPHRIGGIAFDGYLRGSSVLVFNHQKQPGVRVDEDTINSLHEAIGTKAGSRIFIVAPALTFDFQQDYIDVGKLRYYALRIPYSIIHELHQRQFAALRQPVDELAVNDTVDAVGFDFIRTPKLEYTIGTKRQQGRKEAFVRIDKFLSDAVVREPLKKRGNRETLSMVMVDYDYNGDVFDLDAAFYSDALASKDWSLTFDANVMGEQVMLVFLDVYGNEAKEVIPKKRFLGTVGESKRRSAGRRR